MNLKDIIEPGNYWAIDSEHKYHACIITMVDGAPVCSKIPLKRKSHVVSYVKMQEGPSDYVYQKRKSLLS